MKEQAAHTFVTLRVLEWNFGKLLHFLGSNEQGPNTFEHFFVGCHAAWFVVVVVVESLVSLCRLAQNLLDLCAVDDDEDTNLGLLGFCAIILAKEENTLVSELVSQHVQCACFAFFTSDSRCWLWR
jgi:hypothetical protein